MRHYHGSHIKALMDLYPELHLDPNLFSIVPSMEKGRGERQRGEGRGKKRGEREGEREGMGGEREGKREGEGRGEGENNFCYTSSKIKK